MAETIDATTRAAETEIPFPYKVEEISTQEDLQEFLRLYIGVWKKDPEALAALMEEFGDLSVHHIHVVRNEQGEIIGGSKQLILDNGSGMEAYHNKKVVRVDFQSKKIASMLVKTQLEQAKAAGCKTAYCLIANDDQGSVAARSLFKDGYVFKKMRKDKHYEVTDLGHYYYAEKDFDNPPPVVNLDKDFLAAVPQIEDLSGLTRSPVLVPWKNIELINAALGSGYIGVQIVFPKDSGKLTEPALLLQNI